MRLADLKRGRWVAPRPFPNRITRTLLILRGIPLMLKSYVKIRDRLAVCRDKDGIASFEYIIVSVCIITTAGAAFR